MAEEHKFCVRVPIEWHRKAKAEAALMGLSLGKLVVIAVNEYIEREKARKGGKRDG
ncbi:MAG: toxin-antitoxin system HicB family antitoxin [Bacillota bacterium]